MNVADDGPVILFLGGGTGGHLYPSIAIAERLRERRPSARCWVLHSDRAIDARVLEPHLASGLIERAVPRPAAPFGARPRALLRCLSRWGPSVRLTRQLVRDARRRLGVGKGSPRVRAVATGGFVAAPAARAVRTERCPLTLVQLDAVPGLANRYVARLAGRTVLAMSSGNPSADAAGPGPIVRRDAMPGRPPEDARRALGLDPERRVLFITGASQGARSINEFIAAFATERGSSLAAHGWQVLHQTGAGEAEALRAIYAGVGIPGVVLEYLDRIGDAWAAADLVLCRGGAGTVAELSVARVPALVLPYPYHADQHQRLNAAGLERRGAVRVVRDDIRADANLTSVGPVLEELLASPGRLGEMRSAFGPPPPDGAAAMARELLDAAAGPG